MAEYGGVLKLQKDKSYKLYEAPFHKIKRKLGSLNTDVDAPIAILNASSVLIAYEKNLIHYDSHFKANDSTPYKVLINTVTTNDSLLSKGGHYMNYPLPYQLNSLKFEYSSLFYEEHQKNIYQFKLEGFDKKWSAWSYQPNTLFTNLPEGKYTFKVRAKNIYNKISKEACFQFSITPPFYRTWWAYTSYTILLLLFIFVIVRLYVQRLVRQKERLELKVAERTQEMEEKQQKIVEQNTQLYAKQEEVITQNKVLQQIQEEILAQRDLIERKNKELDHKNKKINSSIKVAQTIQQAMLPYQEKLDSLLKEYFIIYKPKDVVSGDFYWLNQVDNKILLIVADCTGHGVPGAFMTLIGNTLLDKIVNVWKITSPSQILHHLHKEITIILRQKYTGNNNGMDLAVISLEKTEKGESKLIFSGAKNSMYYIKGGTTKIHRVRGDRKSIGGEQNESVSFTNKEIIFPRDSLIYLSTDGLQDQNNAERKRFSIQQLMDLLEFCSWESLQKQQQIIEKYLSVYMTDTEQRDDILIMGIKL